MSGERKLERSEALHARARAFVDAFEKSAPSPEPLDALACEIARFQADFVPGFARLVKARGLDPATWARADEIPAVPTDAFKHARVSAFSESETPTTFRTSGTTIGARGEHPFRTLATYDRGALAFGRRSLTHGPGTFSRAVVLGPSPKELPDSSLTHMIDLFAHELTFNFTAKTTYFISDGVIDLETLDEITARALVAGEGPFLVLGTSFAMVHFLDALGEAQFRLPPKSRVMQTGGFKGKSREVDSKKLRRDLSRAFCIAEADIIAEYGMTELSSQFYEQTSAGETGAGHALHGAAHGIYAEPPWARVTPVDPDTLLPVSEGEIGIARIVDLANVDSAVVVLAADRVRRKAGGFELLGRAAGSPPRGCSITIEEMMDDGHG